MDTTAGSGQGLVVGRLINFDPGLILELMAEVFISLVEEVL